MQCKGKDRDYGKGVTERELKAEVKKSADFKPPIREFILITTAPDDAEIQKAARMLEREVRSGGRDLSISVWGWGRIQQEIGRYAEAVKEFHPDASPFTDKILQATDQVAKAVQERGDAQALALAAGHQEILKAIESLGIKVAQEGASGLSAGIEQHLNNEIDGYRDLIRQDKPKTAIELLTKLKDRVWSSASTKVRFRIAVNIGVAFHGLREYDLAASHLLEAAELDPDDPITLGNNRLWALQSTQAIEFEDQSACDDTIKNAHAYRLFE
ncbi:tetratricopeptide (TPR) repeat protein [Bradyrhizobium japonicum]|nr:tetratricopeptide (TPR) repeat protein [Bradyrhizobium japonicum]MCS3994004.1 tetratricopeptide (TPR) repeat protein [Bradyrhizobium japonicum]